MGRNHLIYLGTQHLIGMESCDNDMVAILVGRTSTATGKTLSMQMGMYEAAYVQNLVPRLVFLNQCTIIHASL